MLTVFSMPGYGQTCTNVFNSSNRAFDNERAMVACVDEDTVRLARSDCLEQSKASCTAASIFSVPPLPKLTVE